MGIGYPDGAAADRLDLHPSVGVSAEPTAMTPRQKVAAVAKVRCLEHRLLEGETVRRDIGLQQCQEIVGEINQLRRALGWLELDLEGHWRWPHLKGQISKGAR